MSQTTQTIAVPPEVRAFAAEQGVNIYLPAVVELTRTIFPDATISVVLETDPEIPGDRHVTVLARNLHLSPEQAVEATGSWDRGLLAICPATQVWVFRLGLGLCR